MEYKHDQSYGVVPVYKTGVGYEILLINQIGRRGDLFWTLPKGHPEKDETPELAALRELGEETGIHKVTLDHNGLFTSQYEFIHEGIKVFKRVDYFLGFCDDKETKITQPHEVAELRWCTLKLQKKLSLMLKPDKFYRKLHSI